MRPEQLVVRSNRKKLLLQFVFIVVVGALIGFGIEFWNRFRDDPAQASRPGAPIVGLIFFTLGLLVAIAVLRDSWSNKVVFEPDYLLLDDGIGTTRVHYDNIEEVKSIPMRGVGFVLKDVAQWWLTFEGTPSAKSKKQKVVRLLKQVYGCEICVQAKNLDIGVDRFIAEVRKRLRDK